MPKIGAEIKIEAKKKCCSNLDTLEQHRIEALKRSNTKAYERAQLKYINNAMAGALADTNSSLKKAYLLTKVCMNAIVQEGTEGKTFYCKNRWCNICNRNKMAEMINGYSDMIAEMKHPRFLTLTGVSVNKFGLKKRHNAMLKSWRNIIDNFRKNYGIKIVAIRKLECNHNQAKKTFNPHFHFIIDCNACEYFVILNLYLNQMAKEGIKCDIQAQDIKLADRNAPMELFKYFSKPIVKGKFDPVAQDFIYRTFKGKRLIQKYGNKLKSDTSKVREGKSIQFADPGNHLWQYLYHDWINESAECLTGYIPSVEDIELNKLVKSNAEREIYKQSKNKRKKQHNGNRNQRKKGICKTETK